MQWTKSAARTMSVYVCVKSLYSLCIVKSAYLSNSWPITALLHLSCQHLCSLMPCWKLSKDLFFFFFEDYAHLIYAKYMPTNLTWDKCLYPEIYVSTYFMPLVVPFWNFAIFSPSRHCKAGVAEIKAVCAGLTHWGTEHKGGHTAAELGGG